MIIEKDKIEKAKSKLGNRNAELISEILNVQEYDSRNMKGLCPFHDEDTPSFVYNKKNYSMHCFGCGKTVDLIEAYMTTGHTFLEACKFLFDEANIKYNFGEAGVKTKRTYRYPKYDKSDKKDEVYAYLATRGISKETVDYLDIQQDTHGNCVFHFYDTNDVLTMVKYRPSKRLVKDPATGKKPTKTWCQKDADTTPLLFNMNRINTTSPLLITEGELDCAAAIESGYLNAVSVPLGAGNFHWIEENFDWLEQFDSIILCSDNDKAGNEMRKEVLNRLGSWRTRFVEIPFECDGHKIKDLNELLYWGGKDAVIDAILNAKDTPVDSVSDFSDIQSLDLSEMDGIETGFKELDRKLMKLQYGTFNIITGINGCVSADTEFFNGAEWKPISNYTDGEKVLQYNSDGTATLVEPELFHKYPCDGFYHFRSEYGVDQMVSKEHNLVFLTSKGNINKKSVADVLTQHDQTKHGFYGKFITTFNYSGTGVPFSDEELRVLCAVICDGHFPNRKKDVNNLCRINIKKERKKNRLRMLLEEAGIKYDVRHYNPKDLDYETFQFVSPIVTKSFGCDWYQCTRDQLRIISNEMLEWDGHISSKRHTFSTCDKDIADFVQFAFSASGFRSTIHSYDRVGENRSRYVRKSLEYSVTVTSQIHPSIFNVKHKIEIPYVKSQDGYKYCFTVPSGMLVLRHNGRINITGNSGKTSFLSQLVCNCLDQGKNAFMYSGELPNYQTKNWINFILAGRYNINRYESRDVEYYKVNKIIQPAIDEYYRGKLFVYKDGYSHRAQDILDSMEANARKYGCKLFIIDNLTSVSLGGGEATKWEKQEEFVNKLISFSNKFQVVVILVVHPHKIDTMRRLTKMDIQGISALMDLAHRILSLYRVQDEDRQQSKKKKRVLEKDVVCDILKDRMRGYEGQSVELYYDRPSRRFFTCYEDLYHQYAWDKTDYSNYEDPYPVPQLENLPY